MCFYRTCRLQRNAITVSSVGRSPRQEKKKEERKEEGEKKRRRKGKEKEEGRGGEFKIKGTDSTGELCLSIA